MSFFDILTQLVTDKILGRQTHFSAKSGSDALGFRSVDLLRSENLRPKKHNLTGYATNSQLGLYY